MPLDHPVHAVAEFLTARGVLSGLDGSERPFLLSDLRRSVTAASTDSLPEAERARVLWLRNQVRVSPTRDRWLVSLAPEVGLLGGALPFPELLLAERDSSLSTSARVRFGAEFGPASVQVEPHRLWDGRTYFGVAAARVGGRWGHVEWGKVDRNWGPPGVAGLHRSPRLPSRSDFGFSLGPTVLRFEYRVTPLADGISSVTGEAVGRFWTMHRLRWRPTGRLEVAVWETTVTAESGGADEARFSPFTAFSFPFQQGLDDDRNVTIGLDATWRFARRAELDVQLLLDDFSLRNRGSDNPYPHRFGYTAQLRGSTGGSAWRAYMASLSGLALNTSRRELVYVDETEGLGRLRPDHVEAGGFLTLLLGPADASGSWWPGTGTVEVGFKWRRQGVRSFTDPFPPHPIQPGTRLPTYSPEIEREIVAASIDLDWLVGPLTLQTEAQLQRRRFPISGTPPDWALRYTFEGLWRVGRWTWSGDP